MMDQRGCFALLRKPRHPSEGFLESVSEIAASRLSQSPRGLDEQIAVDDLGSEGLGRHVQDIHAAAAHFQQRLGPPRQHVEGRRLGVRVCRAGQRLVGKLLRSVTVQVNIADKQLNVATGNVSVRNDPATPMDGQG